MGTITESDVNDMLIKGASIESLKNLLVRKDKEVHCKSDYCVCSSKSGWRRKPHHAAGRHESFKDIA